jgi:DNA-binding Lrp family transcriptional regulator
MQPDAKDRPKAATREELIAAIQQDPLANQRDAAEALGVSLGVYQRTRNELIGSGQIKGGLSAPAVDDPQMQRDEMRCSYVNFLQTLTKEEQVEEIKKIIRRELGWTTKEVSSLYPAPIKVKFK